MLVLPFTIFGFSGGTKTVICALRERIAAAPVNENFMSELWVAVMGKDTVNLKFEI
jgi:hypothetical protein